MTYNDTLGSFGRIPAPAVREAMRLEKDKQKKAMERSNAQDIDELENYIQHITTLHHGIIDGIDWAGITSRPRNPERPQSDGSRRIIDEHEAWAAIQAGDDSVILSIIKSRQTLTHHHKLARGLGFSVQDGLIHAVIMLHKPEIIPGFQFKFTPSGKLTEVKMPREKTQSLYRAYAGSAALKVASDLFRLTPRAKLAVTCIAPCILPGMDQVDDWPVLSVVFDHKRFQVLDMARTDPVAGMRLFQVAENWHPQNGFSGIDPLVEIPTRMAI